MEIRSSTNYIWNIKDVLGQGATGAVYKGRHKVMLQIPFIIILLCLSVMYDSRSISSQLWVYDAFLFPYNHL